MRRKKDFSIPAKKSPKKSRKTKPKRKPKKVVSKIPVFPISRATFRSKPQEALRPEFVQQLLQERPEPKPKRVFKTAPKVDARFVSPPNRNPLLPDVFPSIRITNLDQIKDKENETTAFVKRNFGLTRLERFEENVSMYMLTTFYLEHANPNPEERAVFEDDRNKAIKYLEKYGFKPDVLKVIKPLQEPSPVPKKAPEPEFNLPTVPKKEPEPTKRIFKKAPEPEFDLPAVPTTPPKKAPEPKAVPPKVLPPQHYDFLKKINLNITTTDQYHSNIIDLSKLRNEGKITQDVLGRAREYMNLKLEYNRTKPHRGQEKQKEEIGSKLIQLAKPLRNDGFTITDVRVYSPAKKPLPEPEPVKIDLPAVPSAPPKSKPEEKIDIPAVPPVKLLNINEIVRPILQHIHLNITSPNDYQRKIDDIQKVLTSVVSQEAVDRIKDMAGFYMKAYLDLNNADASVSGQAQKTVDNLVPKLERYGFPMKSGAGHCGEDCRVKKVPRKPSQWVLHVKQWAKDHKVKYGVALNSEKCRKSYKKIPIEKEKEEKEMIDLNVKNTKDLQDNMMKLVQGVQYKKYPKKILKPATHYMTASVRYHQAETTPARMKAQYDMGQLKKGLEMFF